jgi:quercetin dioxygenase-like cupin family protein
MTVELPTGFTAFAGQDLDERPWEPFSGMSHVHVKYLFSTPHSVAGVMKIDAGSDEARRVHVGGQHHVWVADGVVDFDGEQLGPGSYLHVPAGMTHTMAAEDRDCTLFFVYLREDV